VILGGEAGDDRARLWVTLITIGAARSPVPPQAGPLRKTLEWKSKMNPGSNGAIEMKDLPA